ncbi:glycosyltransferase family 4 protein [Paenibacillus sp. 481]|uniref:glycosyltransferase family 4 protein n=1 Tax=Paenibacillus sp. 481 TaxID=2835869 RepID=UPI001E3A1C2E|nr:glycosyltransferase family 1 protein [Paenibacillus sp. 481]UHA71648.1 glycosyltransferase family 4 protein [Paenibacillus sp. 481]
MKVCLDGQPLLGNLSGIGRYTACLYEQLQHLSDVDVTLGFNQLFTNLNSEKLPVQASQQHLFTFRYPYKVIRRLMKPNFSYNLPCDWSLKKKFDIYHGTNFTYVPINKGRKIVSIHDLAFMKYPETTSDKIYKHHMSWVPYCANNADHIITISEATKRDIVELLSVAPEKVTVTPLAATDEFQPIARNDYVDVLKKYHLPDNYILFVGTIEARKNLTTLLQAYHSLVSNHQSDIKLVIVGAKGWKTSSLYQYIETHRLEDKVVFTGYVSDEDLPFIYNGATLFAMPSWYEGFGLPLVEAMKCGVPVIGSNTSSIPEVIGPDGLLCDPSEPEDWADKMYAVINDRALREKWCRYSIAQSRQFSWKSTADKTIEVYQSLL